MFDPSNTSPALLFKSIGLRLDLLFEDFPKSLSYANAVYPTALASPSKIFQDLVALITTNSHPVNQEHKKDGILSAGGVGRGFIR